MLPFALLALALCCLVAYMATSARGWYVAAVVAMVLFVVAFWATSSPIG